MARRALFSIAEPDSIPSFALYMVRHLPRQLSVVLALIALATLTEGASLLLLVPILKLVDPTHPHAVLTLATGPLRPVLGATVTVQLGLVLLIFALAVSVRAMLIRQKDVVTAGFLFDLANGLRDDVFMAITEARWAFLARQRGSDIQHALTGDIERVQTAAAQLLQLLQTTVALAVYAVVALALSPIMMAIALALGVVVLAALRPIRRLASRYGSMVTAQRQNQYRIVSEFVSGVKLAKASNTEPLYVAQLSATLHDLRSGGLRFMRAYTLGTMSFQIGTAVGLALFIWLGVGRFAIAYSSLIALVLLFVRLGPRVAAAQGATQAVLSDLPALGAMLRLRDAALAEAEQEGVARPLPAWTREIAFDAVSFGYADPSRRIIDSVSFSIPANLVTAIIGPSGSGKSTLADLLMGLLEPVEGQVRVDDTPLAADNRRAWRDALAYVPQESFLLHDSIASNLRAGRDALTDDQLWAALETANAATFVRALASGLDTVVGDRGVRLSGGERQRIALARALLRRPQVLVLDEATSALDWESQAAIAAAIRTLRGTMTIVTIAHRPSMIAFADRVIAIAEGRIVEMGDYGELSARADSYLAKLIDGDR